MKRLIFGLLAATVAFGGSAFTNAERSTTNSNSKFYDDGYLVQTSENVWQRIPLSGDNGDCTTPVENPCKYLITSTIPTQSVYTEEQVTDTYSGSLDAEDDGNRIYVFPSPKN